MRIENIDKEFICHLVSECGVNSFLVVLKDSMIFLSYESQIKEILRSFWIFTRAWHIQILDGKYLIYI
jgi:hypothetical protein